MSLVFVCIVENDSIYFGQVHWRELNRDVRRKLRRVSRDGGYVLVDKDKEIILDEQSCVSSCDV